MFRRSIAPLVIVIASCLWLASSTCVFACSCIVPGAPQEEAAKSDAVFSGKATRQTAPSGGLDSGEPVKIAFTVGQVWKGEVPQEILVATSGSSASCGYTFETGQEYLVYAHTVEGQLSVSLCSRTRLLAEAQEDLTVLGQSTVPVAAPAAPAAEPVSQSNQPIAIIAGLAVIAAVAAIGGWRYMRRA